MEERKKRILVTGSDGFIAKNLIYELRNRGYEDLLLCNKATTKEECRSYVNNCDVVIHLAGVNRPIEVSEYSKNLILTEELIESIGMSGKKIVFASSVQAELDNPYGNSKRLAENALLDFADDNDNISLSIYRLPNVFGKWCRPYYNSVVATFCHNVARGMEIKINDPAAELRLVYIDDVVNAFIKDIEDNIEQDDIFKKIEESYLVTVGEIARIIKSFHSNRSTLSLPDMSDSFKKKLYSTYLSYLDENAFKYELCMNIDARGSFTEFLRTDNAGQISVNVTKPGIVKGNHWHHTKVEKFLVVSGKASIKFRHMITGNVTEYIVSGDKLEVVDIPPGYTHNISNIGSDNLVTVMWANEAFDKKHPDTFYEEV